MLLAALLLGLTTALTGLVSSPQGPLEGVLVGAKRAGSTITVSVYTGRDGRYAFPADRLAPGRYTLRIRATGYDLDGDPAVDVAPGGTTRDLALKPAADVASQLSNSEWMASMPGTPQQKRALLDCTGCHTLQRIVESKHTAAEWPAVLQRMADYANVSFWLHPQRRMANSRHLNPETVQRVSAFLASVNESAGPRTWPLVTWPRPSGDATRAIVTEYDLPRATIEPHDAVVDARGTVWFSDFGEEVLGALDPRSGAVTEYPIPALKPNFPTGSLALEPDADGNLWLAMMFQGGVARFDPGTKRFTTYAIPPPYNTDLSQVSFVAPPVAHGKPVWFNDVQTQHVFRLDPASGKVAYYGPIKGADGHVTQNYQMLTDPRGDLYTLDFSARDGNYIGMVDGATLAAATFATPTKNVRTRRGHFDRQGRIWFAEYAGNQLGMFDPATKQMREWPMPRAFWQPYDAQADQNGVVWSAGMHSDRVARLDPKSGGFVEYLLPRETNVRRIFVDTRGARPVVWIGNNHAASVVKLETLPQ